MPFIHEVDAEPTMNLILVPVFGDLSKVEITTAFGARMTLFKVVCDRAYLATVSGVTRREVSRLGGFHKIGVAFAEGSSLISFRRQITTQLENMLKKNISMSLYCSADSDEEYNRLLQELLKVVRESGIRRIKVIRPASGSEIFAEQVSSRDILDFLVVKQGAFFIFGTTWHVLSASEIEARSKGRPYEGSRVTMSPRLARTLVNISNASAGDTLLDPFCGSGTILGEAMLLGINCIGVDSDPNKIQGAKQNLDWLRAQHRNSRLGSFTLKVGDARSLSDVVGCLADAVVTEPILLPTFRHTPNYSFALNAIRKSQLIYSAAIPSIAKVLKKGGRAVIVTPEVITKGGKSVQLELQDYRKAGLEPQLQENVDGYSIDIGAQSTRWVRRKVHIFKKV